MSRFGDTSKFTIHFKYDPELISELKSQLHARFHSVAKHWSVTIYSQETAKKVLEFAELNLFKMEDKDKKYLRALAEGRLAPPPKPAFEPQEKESAEEKPNRFVRFKPQGRVKNSPSKIENQPPSGDQKPSSFFTPAEDN